MRVVSLVPSATETLLGLGVVPVAVTRFCEQPGLPTVGGTKTPDVEAIVALAPDVVVMNDEENRRADHDALVSAGLRVHSISPRSVADVGPAVGALAAVVGASAPEPFATRWADWLAARRLAPSGARVVTMVWRRPWMALGVDTYGASVLAVLGLVPVVPEPRGPDRYPAVSLEEIARLGPELVLLPSEPYAFTARHARDVGAAVSRARVRLVDGRDLFWWGLRTPVALDRLAPQVGVPVAPR